MDWNVLWTGAGVIVAVVFGIGGIVTGVIALVQTRRANRIALQANEIAQRAIDRDTEDWPVSFTARWDFHAKGIVFTNNSRHVALSAVFIVNRLTSDDAESVHEVASPGDIAGGVSYTLEIPALVDEKTRIETMMFGTPIGRYMTLQGKHYQTKASCDIEWKTGKGFPKNQHIDITVK